MSYEGTWINLDTYVSFTSLSIITIIHPIPSAAYGNAIISSSH